ncbi:NlpC/P60 family protein [Actinoplanes sp. NPDC051411]|uniref:NlpC/P60 family protein n=1 Tax=Actinoplanes sp. NPDC051411 TaxID=3155522 RepID=UPI00344837BB
MKTSKWVLGAAAGLLVLCGLPLSAVLDDDPAAAACGTSSSSAQVTTSPQTGAVGRWSAAQVANAAIIVDVGRRLGVPARGWVIAVATAMVESGLTNLGNLGGRNDHDSLGLFQQRPSQGWGTPTQLQDPIYASTAFYHALQRLDGWQTLPLTEAAQKVQRSGFPDRYADYEGDAQKVVAAAAAVTSGNPQAIADDLDQCVSSCPVIAASSSSGSTDDCTEPNAVFERAKSWLTAWSGGPVPYRSSNAPGELLHGYRRDCSGYVSMALGLPGPGLTTVDLAARSTVLTKIDLKPGDLMINPALNLQGHVVLFERWADPSMTSYWGYEQSGDGGTHYRRIPYPYWGSYPMKPYRFEN